MERNTGSDRRSWRLPLVAVLLLLALWGLMAATGTPHAAYRVPGGQIETSIQDLVKGSDEYRAGVESKCVETHLAGGAERFKVGFVEFDDQGEFWERRQLEVLEEEIRRAAASPEHDGVLLVTFVHGWQHNASICDQNVSCFRDMLEALANTEDFRAHALNHEAAERDLELEFKPRYVFGIYVGWRGLGNPVPVLRELTFYNRKAAAHRVGGGDVIELFTRLEVWRDRLRLKGNGDSKLVILGHSFGGAVTYTAVSKVLHERLARAAASPGAGADRQQPIQGFGDLVVLVNPAFEASLYGGIYDLAQRFSSYPPSQPAVLVTVSSDTDSATHLAFPAGRFLATRFLKTRDRRQAESLTATIGNFEPYRTHRLELASEDELAGDFLQLADLDFELAGARGSDDCRCDYFEAEVKDAGSEDPFGEFRLSPAGGIFGDTKLTAREGTRRNIPFITATTVDDVISNHNGIYNRHFMNFLRAFLLEMDRRTLGLDDIEREGEAEAVAIVEGSAP